VAGVVPLVDPSDSTAEYQLKLALLLTVKCIGVATGTDVTLMGTG
jgi:hypothetical protein